MKLLDRLTFAVQNPWAALDRVIQLKYMVVEITPGVTRKAYGSYTDYLRHQRRKVRWRSRAWLADYEAKYRAVLGDRVRVSGLIAPGARVLCLAARRGGEVRAFRGREWNVFQAPATHDADARSDDPAARPMDMVR
jgi:hypothetical protein